MVWWCWPGGSFLHCLVGNRLQLAPAMAWGVARQWDLCSERDFYVDGLTSLPTADDAKNLIAQVTTTCAKANIRLHKFISNDADVMKAIPASEGAARVLNLDIEKHTLPTERALGIQWNVSNSELQSWANLAPEEAYYLQWPPSLIHSALWYQSHSKGKQSCKRCANWRLDGMMYYR